MADTDVFTVDVEKLHCFIDKFVKIKLKNIAEEIDGVVFSIDPVSENVLLLNKENGNISLTVIMKHTVQEITLQPGIPDELLDVDTSQLFLNTSHVNEVEISKEQLTTWLTVSRIPFEEVGDVIEVEGVNVHPPYRSNDCLSSSPIKLLSIQHLLKTVRILVESNDPRLN